MNKHSLIRTVYLYLFSLVGLTLLIIGFVRFIDMGLRAFIFTQADQERMFNFRQPPQPQPLEKLKNLTDGQQSVSQNSAPQFSDEEKTAIRRWLVDYQNWKAQSEKINPVAAQRQRDASSNLAMIIVGLPLYLFHWRMIRRSAAEVESALSARPV